jgi:hypothetical protein|tara:strand:- start:1355 stop:1720 length:366 start_codon:yes stop_codon:yes gene_type:complete
MADSGIFATTAEVKRKVGANASSTSNSEAYINQYISEAESYINSVCRHNYSDSYAGLNADVKSLLKEAASNIAAVYVIQYDFSQYEQIAEPQLMINVLWERTNKCITELKDKKTQDFINGS